MFVFPSECNSFGEWLDLTITAATKWKDTCTAAILRDDFASDIVNRAVTACVAEKYVDALSDVARAYSSYEKERAFAPYRLVAAFADGSRLLFDGLTEEQAYNQIASATKLHGDVAWYDGVTDQHYEKGRYYKIVPESGLHVTKIDLTEYDGPLDKNGLPPSLTGNPPQEE